MIRRPCLTHEQITRLIREVRRQPCLWNRKHENYNDIFHVGTAWKTIAGNLRLSENTVKLKWKNLRDTFNRTMSRDPSAGTSYNGDWPYFQHMTFLLSSRPKKNITVLEVDNQDYDVLVSVNDEEAPPHSDEYYDLLFLESLTPYFMRLQPTRSAAMRVKILDMLMREIKAQNDENQEDESC